MEGSVEAAIETLLRECTVGVSGDSDGSGFWIAPGFVVTAAHVVGHRGSVEVRHQGHTYHGTVLAISEPPKGRGWWPYPDLAVVSVMTPPVRHHCLRIDYRMPSRAGALVAAGGSSTYGHSADHRHQYMTASPRFAGIHGPGDQAMWRVEGDELPSGMSGGPVLNQNTCLVSAVTSFERLPDSHLGGLVVPIQALRHLNAPVIREVRRAHDSFHATDQRWPTLFRDTTRAGTGQVTESEERALLGILARLPESDDHLAMYLQSAGTLSTEPQLPLLTHGDVIAELSLLPQASEERGPRVLSYVLEVARRIGPGASTADLIRWAGDLQHRLAHPRHGPTRPRRAADRDPLASVIACLQPVSYDRNMFWVRMWRFSGSASMVDCSPQLDPQPLGGAVEALKAALPAQISILHRLSARVAIEVFLPRDLLNLAVDEWRIHADRQWSALGSKHAVVVRDIARFQRSVDRRAWLARWNAVADEDLALSLNPITCADIRTHEVLESWFELDESRAVLALPTAPEPTATSAALDVGLPAGVPVYVWPRNGCRGCNVSGSRYCSSHSFYTWLRQALAGVTVKDLPERFRRLRNEAVNSQVADHWASSMALLWDDPRRLPPQDRLTRPTRWD